MDVLRAIPGHAHKVLFNGKIVCDCEYQGQDFYVLWEQKIRAMAEGEKKLCPFDALKKTINYKEEGEGRDA